MDPTCRPDPVADSRRQLLGAGWSLGIVPITTRGGDSGWLVTARKDGHWVVARGATPALAWGHAVDEARSLAIGKEDVEGRFVLRDGRTVEPGEGSG